MNEAVAGELLTGPGVTDIDYQCENETESFEALRDFTHDMVSVIHKESPHVLVALGTRGSPNDCGTIGEHYAAIAEEVDVCEVHSYDASLTLQASLFQGCWDIGRPVIMGESASSARLAARSVGLDGFTGYGMNLGPLVDKLQQPVMNAQAHTLVNNLVTLSQGGLAGTHFWYFTAPSQYASIDDYSLPAGHPIYGLLSNITTADLLDAAGNYRDFRTLAANLTPPAPPPDPFCPQNNPHC